MIYEPDQCPVRFGLGAFGDRWSLLIIRDMMFRGSNRFRHFMEADEGISTNVLSDRLARLEEQNIISRRADPESGRQVLYDLTDKGADLLPVMLAIFGWAGKHDPRTNVSDDLAEKIQTDPIGARNEIQSTLKRSDLEP